MSKRKIQLILVAIVAVASALLLVFWRRPADKTPDVDTDPRTAGTRAMALRLDAIAHAWESKPFVDTPERSFRANRPSWIPALRQRATAATVEVRAVSSTLAPFLAATPTADLFDPLVAVTAHVLTT